MNVNSTLAKVYAAIVAIPLGAILLAGAVGGGPNEYGHDDYERDLSTSERRDGANGTGTNVTEAEAYRSLGKYNPCIFIECEGE
jgi:hypothetical protein